MSAVTLPELARPDLVPGITSNIPTAYGAYSGQGGVGIGFQRLRFAARANAMILRRAFLLDLASLKTARDL
jgi:uncharacterized membrane protein (UPF0182 family)